MKKLIACFTITTFIFSCQTTKSTTAEKQPETKEATQENTIIGKWRLIKTSGGFTGRTQNQSPNQVEILEFTSTEMIHISNGKETSRVKYTLGKGKSIHSTNQVPMIFIGENTTKGQSYTLDGNTLGISQEFYDGFYYTYIKIGKNDDGLLKQ